MTTKSSQTDAPSLDNVAIFSPWLGPVLRATGTLSGGTPLECPRGKPRGKLEHVVGFEAGDAVDGAKAYAARHGLRYLPVTLGVYVGRRRGPLGRPCSLWVGEAGPANSARALGVLERLLDADDTSPACGPGSANGASEGLDSPALLERAENLRKFIVEHRLSRYADDFAIPEELKRALDSTAVKPVVVVVPAGVGLDHATTNRQLTALEELLDLAKSDHPNAAVLLLDDSSAFERDSKILALPHLRKLCERHPKTQVLPLDIDRGWLLERIERVYTVDSTFGFEALLRRVPVVVLGNPFYAGRGLTVDLGSARTPRRARTLGELIAIALLVAPKYYDPVCDCETTAEKALRHLSLQRERFLQNRGHFLCIGFSLWKRAIVQRYLSSPGNRIEFLRDSVALGKRLQQFRAAGSSLPKDLQVATWASRPHDATTQLAEQAKVPLLQLEDGFLRSTGLGSDWAAPGSLVFDRRGIYYDPRKPSDLEELLSHAQFTDSQLCEAEALRQQIVALRVSKYNTHVERAFTPSHKRGQRVVLVPGQVADDASVRLGGAEVASVETMLERVRALEPDAHIVYKPHPDVLSGNRRGLIDEGLGTWFDELVLDVPLARCLDVADSVHTISSLVGFEALLRGLPVTCHGQPFYCGWGLTVDRAPLVRRKRQLTLPMLVAGVLLLYPRYYHFESGSFCSAAQMVKVLALARLAVPQPNALPKWVRRAQSLLKLALDLKHAG